MTKTLDIDEEIKKAKISYGKNYIIGVENDLILQPSTDEVRARYYVNRNGSLVTLIDTRNREIVMNADIGQLVDIDEHSVSLVKSYYMESHTNLLSINNIILYVRYITRGIYIVGIQGLYHLLCNSDFMSSYRKASINPQAMSDKMQEYENRAYDRSVEAMGILGGDTGLLTERHERLFLCLKQKAHKIVQFLHKGDLLVVDLGAGADSEEVLKRVCINIRTGKILADCEWRYGEFKVGKIVPEIVCTENHIYDRLRFRGKTLLCSNNAKGGLSGSLNGRARRYDYEGNVELGSYYLHGDLEDFIIFDGIGKGRHSVKMINNKD
jgi:hypothetical protein